MKGLKFQLTLYRPRELITLQPDLTLQQLHLSNVIYACIAFLLIANSLTCNTSCILVNFLILIGCDHETMDTIFPIGMLLWLITDIEIEEHLS